MLSSSIGLQNRRLFGHIWIQFPVNQMSAAVTSDPSPLCCARHRACVCRHHLLLITSLRLGCTRVWRFSLKFHKLDVWITLEYGYLCSLYIFY